jgi:hypothetical protein
MGITWFLLTDVIHAEEKVIDGERVVLGKRMSSLW